MAPIRKYPSGAEKRKKKKRIEALVKLQPGSLNKYFNTKSATTYQDTEEQIDEDGNFNETIEETEDMNVTENIEVAQDMNAIVPIELREATEDVNANEGWPPISTSPDAQKISEPALRTKFDSLKNFDCFTVRHSDHRPEREIGNSAAPLGPLKNFIMTPIRKYPSGAQKRKKKKRIEALVKL